MSTPSGTPDTPPDGDRRLAARASRFAEVALANITREYPNAPAHLLAGPHELVPPRTLHPAFYGAYDWHSSVHMHWLLLRLLRLPWDDGGEQERSAALREETVRTLDSHLTAASLSAEAAYLRAHPWFERPYGWAWLLALTAESAALSGEEGRDAPVRNSVRDAARRWHTALVPAAATVAELLLAWLPKATYPVRHGTHANSAFALGLVLDSAERAGQPQLVTPIADRIRTWYLTDQGAATRWEPSGQDFLSPLLCEADAVRRVLPPREFADWLDRFLPELRDPVEFLPPPRISDTADPQIGHLLGLCLSRAAALRALAGALPQDDPRIPVLTAAATANLAAGLPATTSGDFTTDHWLATFAALALGGGVRA
ncbi:DUF2891 family protein [Streptomyces thermodiastaticus]|uniref:DUF2891 family protein n=1 Tax=Streptomyces thermodiastaticus TaxID=44061 RepID=UPI001678B2F0|nr:DUF2891 family protein [Streptomyces thermodiastaticus]MCE7551064.1 DUF2891 domain-containing protein [Streptomyces thermodiastaticus]GHF58359.1 hypothetical protein GCM10018787_03230 [Streptomyces thermodiastaticus]